MLIRISSCLKNEVIKNAKGVEINIKKWYNVLTTLFSHWGDFLKKTNMKQKQWLLAKSAKAIKRLQKKNRIRKPVSNQANSGTRTTTLKSAHKNKIVAPEKFGMMDNIDETLQFFGRVKETLKKLKVNESIYFDLSKVQVVSADAIMYLIATIRNTKRINALKIRCAGNAPSNPEARQKFLQSGFYDYVSSSVTTNNIYTDHIKIKAGKEAEPVLAGEICDFVHSLTGLSIVDTKFLFPMIIELMTNTKQHAYNSVSSMDNNWYIYVEDRGDSLKFIFLDTGVGIPKTIRTKFGEKIISILSNSDAYFIASALRGEFRSETRLDYRGKGLPEIYNRITSAKIEKFAIVSGQGKCVIDESGAIVEIPLKNALNGTLLSWNLKK